MTSDFDECESGRSVSLFFVVPGFGTSRRVGRTKTKANGSWAITKKNPDGQYYATAKPSRVTTPLGDTINCRKARSRKVNA